ncbi:sulfur carrier protein ThiS, partial [Candidatus Sumerlaeota bacterium]|nr:sulfur carrier protein ThiS [Candidatus Sumerlaeota bacterium]
RVAVVINGDVINRENHAATVLADGDTVDIVHMVGGG